MRLDQQEIAIWPLDWPPSYLVYALEQVCQSQNSSRARAYHKRTNNLYDLLPPQFMIYMYLPGRADLFPILHHLAHVAAWGRIICIIHLYSTCLFPGLDLYYADATQTLMTAGEELDNLDLAHDLSQVWMVDTYCVRDKGTNANHWLIGLIWLAGS